ncbi:MAG: hypothetical protein ACE5GW_07135 [Planctomycetota bacterium]
MKVSTGSIALLMAAFLLCAGGIAGAQTTKAKTSGDPYPLSTCPVSGEKLGSMGDPIVFQHEGREIRFCCKGCVPKFKAEPGKYLERTDEKIIRQQVAHYPLDTCMVSGEPLAQDGKPVDRVVGNRLVRFCCKMCVKDFKKDPAKHLKTLDKAVVKKQSASYPLTTCPVTGKKLGAMGKPYEMVVANRLILLCCKGCNRKITSNPQKYLAMLDKEKSPKGKGDKPTSRRARGNKVPSAGERGSE